MRACHEARIATTRDSRGKVYVTCRSLTGDNRRLGPFFVEAHVEQDGPDLELRLPARDDRCWLLLDASGDPACIAAWEPR